MRRAAALLISCGLGLVAGLGEGGAGNYRPHGSLRVGLYSIPRGNSSFATGDFRCTGPREGALQYT
jgi:hypothetical protein